MLRKKALNGISIEETRELFQNGSIERTDRKPPKYAKVKNKTLMLHPGTLRDPLLFSTALHDYIHSLPPDEMYQKRLGVSDSEWQRHLQSSTRALQRSYRDAEIQKVDIQSRIMGQTGEFAVAHWIDGMIQKFGKKELRIVLPRPIALQRWNGIHQEIKLGGDYTLHPVDDTNVIIRNKIREYSLGEMDMLILDKINEVAFFLDVSTSRSRVEEKIWAEEEPEAKFLVFRDKMKRVFREGKSEGGLRNAVKIHVICNGDSPAETVVFDNVNGNSVLTVGLNVHPVLSSIMHQTMSDLLASGILREGEADICVLTH